MRMRRTGHLAAMLLGILGGAVPAQAQAPDRFPREITLYVGSAPGGGYDLNARVLARHMGRHLPGIPTITIRNMPGEGGVTAANFLYSEAPRDGSVFGTFGSTVLLDPLLRGKNDQFDARKFTLIGSTANEVSTCIAWHTAKVRSFDDVLNQELVVGATGPSSVSGLYPRILNTLLGTKFRLVPGYASSAAAVAAMEKGEIEGFCGLGWPNLMARPDWLASHSVNVLLQLGLAKPREHQDVPLAMDYAKTRFDAQVLELVFAPQVFARPFLAPPGLPDVRAAWLREAFNATVDDDDFITDATAQKLEPELVRADQLRTWIDRFYSFPQPVVDRARTALE